MKRSLEKLDRDWLEARESEGEHSYSISNGQYIERLRFESAHDKTVKSTSDVPVNARKRNPCNNPRRYGRCLPTTGTMKIGTFVYVERKRLGYSQTSFAKRIGVKQPFVSDIERGKYRIGPGLLAKIANALDCTQQKLLEFQREGTP